MRPLSVLQLGIRPYAEVRELQRSIQSKIITGDESDTLILCQHTPVITLGTAGDRSHLLVSDEELQRLGVELVRSERGGNITYHAPGQLVVYPLIDLRHKKRDVHWYMRTLERSIIRLLNEFGLSAEQVPGKTGVWTKPIVNAIDFPLGKVASIGVRISRWCTMHGFALNIFRDPKISPDGFALMNPCGLEGVEMVWLNNLLPNQDGPVLLSRAIELYPRIFCEEFDFKMC